MLGREGANQYDKSLAGVRPKNSAHQFDFPVSAYSEDGKLLPEIQKEHAVNWAREIEKFRRTTFG